ncbi:hypothetical protein MOQ72_00260 [Saccharopolyspora sp. K220]|uniref:hypothetical protein n=1 Tax=Saccharopolyspora soli TaxID=2926618 RepID=UPI001F56F1D8|nr:hypothetical protein [Saccharopolyspora soli]MCI2415842.1 hypothetical protein [Saccharopolyspora soli]
MDTTGSDAVAAPGAGANGDRRRLSLPELNVRCKCGARIAFPSSFVEGEPSAAMAETPRHGHYGCHPFRPRDPMVNCASQEIHRVFPLAVLGPFSRGAPELAETNRGVGGRARPDPLKNGEGAVQRPEGGAVPTAGHMSPICVTDHYLDI